MWGCHEFEVVAGLCEGVRVWRVGEEGDVEVETLGDHHNKVVLGIRPITFTTLIVRLFPCE